MYNYEYKFKALYSIYITTNLFNAKQYIGVHGTHTEEDSYLGSGTVLIQAIKRWSVEAFHRFTLFTYQDEQEAYIKEEELVNYEYISRADPYNVALGGNRPDANLAKTPEARKKAWSTRKENARINNYDPLAKAHSPEAVLKRTSTRMKEIEERGGYYGDWTHTPKAKAKMMKTRILNAEKEGKHYMDHLRTPEARRKANESISKALKKVLAAMIYKVIS